VVLAASMLATACGGKTSTRAPGKTPPLGPGQAEVTVPSQASTEAIPALFLGLSTEFTTLPLVEEHAVIWERVLGNLSPFPVFPLRIGGDSSEHVELTSRPIRLPPWALQPTPELVSETARVMSQSQLQLMIDINTVISTPDAVAAWMGALLRSLHHQLNHGNIAAFELGNEPDIYSQKAWVGGVNIEGNAPANPGHVEPANLPREITPTSFAKTYQAYARALHSAAPTVPLMAPALADATHLGWIKTLLRYRTRSLKVITVHIYPYSACAHPGQPTYPTIQKILSENATAGLARTVRPAVALAQHDNLGVRVTELNSVTCGGLEGVSNTFATALWAPDAMFELMRAGVEGVNVHARVTSINRPFSFNQQGLQTRPLLYGLMLFKRMLGGGDDRLVPVQVRSSRSLALKVWAVRALVSEDVGEGTPFVRNPLKMLVINKGPRSALITLHLPTRSRAFVQRLLAPSASSTSGVTLDGQQLSHQGFWQGKQTMETLSPTGNGSYVLRVRGQSAALLTVPVAPRTLDAPPEKVAGPAPMFGYA
jgi:hypothetical protein